MKAPDAAAADPPIRSRADFQQAVHAAFAEAADTGCPALWLCDADFTAWPLGERTVVDDLDRWVASRRRLHLVAANFEAVARQHPRWVAWRRTWAHVVECRCNPDREPGDFPTLLIAPGRFALELHDRVGFRGRVSRSAPDIVRSRERLDAVLQQSVDAFPAHPTGL